MASYFGENLLASKLGFVHQQTRVVTLQSSQFPAKGCSQLATAAGMECSDVSGTGKLFSQHKQKEKP